MLWLGSWEKGAGCSLIPRVPITIPAICPELRPLSPLDMGIGAMDEVVEYGSLLVINKKLVQRLR